MGPPNVAGPRGNLLPFIPSLDEPGCINNTLIMR